MIIIEIVRRAVDVALALYRRSRTRHQLANLDERLLRDVGLNPFEAAEEAKKPFWR